MQTNATRNIPDHYAESAHIDLSKDRRLLIGLNLLGIVLFILFGWFFLWLAALLRPTFQSSSGVLNLRGLISILAAIVLTFVLHEWVHGFFFWIFTRSRPKYGFKGAYAYASAPGWYLKRNAFLVVGLAPLVLISLGGVLLLPFMPSFLVNALLILLVMNASGAVGDLAVVLWLLRYPHQTFVLDEGDAITVYTPSTNPPD